MSSKSVVPRGFSRFYVLSLLKERPMTGKEIMEETAFRTEGAWRPSPGLVYPLLGKLLSGGLVEEVEEGRGYRITRKGEDILSQYQLGKNELENITKTLAKLGVFGQLMAKDAADRMTTVIKAFREDFAKLGAKQQEKYRKFLESELERLNRLDAQRKVSPAAPPQS